MVVGLRSRTIGRALVWKTAIDVDSTASWGSLFQSGMVLTKKEYLYVSQPAEIGSYRSSWLVFPVVESRRTHGGNLEVDFIVVDFEKHRTLSHQASSG